jgi:hypothetical protein
VKKNRTTSIALATAGGSVGGIMATACAFSFPTLYFLDPDLFVSLMAQPSSFALFMTWLCLAAGGLAYLIANVLEYQCIVQEQMPFPIGQLVYKMIAAQNQTRKALELVAGLVLTSIWASLQYITIAGRVFIAPALTLMRPISVGLLQIPQIQLRLDILPMLIAIGFISGHIIALPLLVGAFAKIFIVDPLNSFYFPTISNADFVLAFCSGMVAIGALQSFLDFPALVRSVKKSWSQGISSGWWRRVKEVCSLGEIALVAFLIIGFLHYTTFSLFAQIYLVFFTCICAYQIIVIAGKIGLAQLGRFATFVMVPAMFSFGADPLRLTIIATFVEICGGVATDMLFGRKMGYMGEIDKAKVRQFQLAGLFISSLTIGIVFWLLINHFGLGSQQLFAQRAQARALLINVHTFNIVVLAFGALFGLLLKYMKINPMLVLGGLLMPLSYSLGLIIGGMIAVCTPNRQEWEPFWSGVFAANSITEIIKTIV